MRVHGKTLLAPVICEDCEKAFYGGPNAYFCPECRAKRIGLAARKNAKKRALNKLGSDAKSGKGK